MNHRTEMTKVSLGTLPMSLVIACLRVTGRAVGAAIVGGRRSDDVRASVASGQRVRAAFGGVRLPVVLPMLPVRCWVPQPAKQEDHAYRGEAEHRP